MRQALTRLVLAGSGALLGLIGGSMLFEPQEFLGMSGVEISSDPDLLSELKAPSGLLVIVGVIMLAGSVRIRFANLGLITGGIVYGSYGLARSVGMVMDGFPSGPLMIATAIEVMLAAILLLLHRNDPASASKPT